jgi:GxxExxY protein
MSELIYEDLTRQIIGIAMRVHRNLGAGFVEKVYQRALYLEFKNSKIKFEREKEIEIKYTGARIGYFNADFIIDDKVIIELKATDHIGDIHLAQIISYLKAAGLKVGLIINFANKSLEWKRVVV